jgi:chemotaxis protein methyltransferase CheR
VSAQLSTSELHEFQRLIAARVGLRFDEGKLEFLAEVLARRSRASSRSATSYLLRLRDEQGLGSELRALASELTVGETYFFRHHEQFTALFEAAIPERLAARAESRRLCLLSVGCASGEEAYSLAILVRARSIEPSYKVHIRGLDLNPEALARARRGRYTAWSLRATADAVRQRWFSREGADFQLLPEVRSAVSFEEHNLVGDLPRTVPAGSCDVIFCRNVLMYFTPEHYAAVVRALTRALCPGGYLFLGHAETLRGISHDFQLQHTHGAFYYQRRSSESARQRSTAVNELAGASSPPASEPSNWVEIVKRSNERIRALGQQTPRSAPEPNSADTKPIARSAVELSHPLELLRNERFAEALNVLGNPPAATPDARALLLRAAILTQQGEPEAAETACRELLAVDELNAGAHYLLALCCERQHRIADAIEHDQTAVYLDSDFAMPHLHLGLMARRRQDTHAARRELSNALPLLEREDPERVLLFGGGFGREALLILCRSELASLTGAS